MPTEMVEYGPKVEEKVKDVKNEIKENVQGTNSHGKEIGTEINDLEKKEERNIQPEQNEKTRIQNNDERLRNFQDNFKHSNVWIIGVPEGEDEEQDLENLFEKLMRENIPNLEAQIAQEIQNIQEAQRVPEKLDTRKHTPRHIIITLVKMKDKERKQQKKRRQLPTKEFPLG